MPRLAANLTTMFTELAPIERFAAARQVGFDAVEYLQPYGHTIEELRMALTDNELELILVNTRMGNAEAGERGVAALPGRENDFKTIASESLEYASELGAGLIHVMAGVVPDDTTSRECEDVFIENLRATAPVAANLGITLLIEPLNSRDVPGYLHNNSIHSRRIIDAVAMPNVLLQFDFYHLQIMEGDLAEGLSRHWPVLGHVQFSSVPGRNEPQYGEVNIPHLLGVLDDMGYSGWVGCEYRARTTTIEGLSWAAPWGIGSKPSKEH